MNTYSVKQANDLVVDQINAARKKLGMKVGGLAGMCDMNKQTMANKLYKTSPLRVGEAIVLCKLFGISLDSIDPTVDVDALIEARKAAQG